MNTGAGMLLIIIGLLMLYALITGKFGIIEHAFYQLFGLEDPTDKEKNASIFDAGYKAGRAAEQTATETGITLPGIFVPDYTKK